MGTAKKFSVSIICLAIACAVCTLCACGNVKPSETPKIVVRYSTYGATGNGVTDDFEAIKSAHEDANAHGFIVKADKGSKYYIGAHKDTVKIRTDTDWTGAEFIIDDTGVDVNDRSHYVFEVSPDKPAEQIDVPSGYSVSAGQKQLDGLNLESPALLIIENNEKKDYIRYGANQNSGSTRQETLLVDKDGNVSDKTPVLWDYEKVTKITAYSVTEEEIVVKGGTFTTKANRAKISASYYTRGINVRRSNTTLSGITHYIEGEGDQGSPYTGFYVVNYANHVVIENCVLSGHKTYINNKNGTLVQQGTYDTQAVRSNDVLWRNCTQANNITDTTRWGVMASNFCKNLKMEGCSLSRFDAHQGVYNATIKDTVLGQNLTIVGAGTLTIENVTRPSGNYFMQLRTDYGSTWNGDIIIKDCKFKPDGTGYVINTNWNDWDFGYTCYMPANLTLDNFKLESEKPCYIFTKITDENAQAIKNSKNPYVITQKIYLKNGCSDLVLTANTSGILNGVEIVKD